VESTAGAILFDVDDEFRLLAREITVRRDHGRVQFAADCGDETTHRSILPCTANETTIPALVQRSNKMPVIDEEGRLFGTINVVDALVVLLVVAVGVAGIALVSGGPSGNPETRHVTLDIGTQPDYVIERIQTGDVATVADQPTNLTITDTYLPTTGDETRALARVRVTGEVVDGTFRVAGEPLRLGRSLRVETDAYLVDGTVRAVGNATELPVEERTVVLQGTVPDGVARTVETGDRIRTGGETLASIRDVKVYAADNPDRRTLYVVANLQTFATGDGARFGNTRVETGRTLSFALSGYRFNGTIERVGGGFEQTTDETIVTSVVDADTATAMSAGDTYTVAGQSVATIQNVSVYDTDNPDRKRVYVGLSVTTLRYGQQPRFGTRILREGSTVPFRTNAYDFSASVVQYRTSDLQQTTEAVVVTDVVDAAVADRLVEGDTYTVGGRPVATVENVVVYGTGDPDRKRVYVGLSVQAVGFGEQPRFGANRSLREGATLPVRTQSYEFNGEIVRLGTLTQPGETTERTVTLRMENVPPDRADSVEAGFTETNAGQTVARVTDIEVEPAVVTVTSEDGNIYERDHPVNKDVTLAVELRVREQESGVRFKGRTLQEGNEVVLDLGTTTVRATVVDLYGT
jgi:hypothetical protein